MCQIRFRPTSCGRHSAWTYDTNILRRTTGDNSEVLTRAGVGGRWDSRVVGRQGLHLLGRS